MSTKSPQIAHIAEFKFRPLKKNLSHSFKQLRHSVESGNLPDKKVIEQFLDHVNLMVSYPGFGDEFYAPFKEACEQLVGILSSNDITRLAEQLQQIHTLKKQCHNRFK